MKTFRYMPLCLLAALPLGAVRPGDSYEQVIAEKGAPPARMEMGATLILSYPDQRIKLKDKTVVAVEARVSEPPPPAPSSPPAAPGSRSAPQTAPKVPNGAAALWRTDYQSALMEARNRQAKVFLFFTGSDWCGWCRRLDEEILSTPEFTTYAISNLVLVKLDFPRQAPQSDELKKQNAQLAGRYRISGYPSIVVLDGEGRPVGRFGYQKGGPAPFVAALREL